MAIYVPTEFFEQINKMLFLPQCARRLDLAWPCLDRLFRRLRFRGIQRLPLEHKFLSTKNSRQKSLETKISKNINLYKQKSPHTEISKTKNF